MPDTTNPQAGLRAVFTVTVETKPDGDYYFDQSDFVRHVVPWIEGGLDDRDDIRTVTVVEQPAAAPSAPADRAAILREAADAAAEKYRRNPWTTAADVIADVRRMADEAQQPETGGCWCGHSRDRHWSDEGGRMTFPDGCHDCTGWNGAHAYGQELPWAADEQPAVEAQQPETQAARRVLTPNEHDRAWHAIEGAAGDPGADPGTVLNAVLRALRIDAPTAEDEQAASPRRKADGTRQDETLPAEDPARIDGLRPEFTEHASVESIDVQLRRARSQLRRWHLRVEWLISLRQARVEQKERGEWPAAVSQPGKEA